MPDFPGPPPDAWIDQLDEYSVTSPPQLTTHYHCSFSAMERSLPKFDLGKFDGSPLHWPLWIGRFKSIVHDKPFLNDGQRLAYLQNTVTDAAESEIQFLGEDGANYILALRMLKARFADSGKIVRAAIAALKAIPSPRPQDQCYEKCLSHITEHSRTGNHSAMTHLCKNLPERSIHYVIYSN